MGREGTRVARLCACMQIRTDRGGHQHSHIHTHTIKQNAMRHPKAHLVLESCTLGEKDFAPSSVDGVLLSKPDGRWVLVYVLASHHACQQQQQ